MIRPLHKTDAHELGLVLALVQHSQHVQHVELEGRDSAEESMLLAAESWDENLGDPAANYFVDTDDEAIKGYILVRQLENDTALIDDLGVSQSFLRRGIGTRLVEHAIEWAKQHRFTAIELITENDNVPAAMTYRKAGFTERPLGQHLKFEKLLG